MKGEKGSKRKPQQPTALTTQKGGEGKKQSIIGQIIIRRRRFAVAIIPGKGSSLSGRRWFSVYPSLFFIQRRGEEGGESNRKGKQNKGAKKKVMCTQGGDREAF